MSSEAREFEMTIAQTGTPVVVELSGALSERVELSAAPVPKGVPVVVDAGGINKINSLGVRSWIRFLDALCASGPDVVLRRMSPVLVLQASMISTFLSKTRVESYLSPWCCPRCSHLLELLHGVYDRLPDTTRCPRCHSNMEFDADPDVYMTFAEMCQAIAEPAGARAATQP